MNIKETVRGRHGGAGVENVNLTGFMNVVLILIPFLLLTASFVRLAVVDMTLPNLGGGGQGGRQAASAPVEKAVLNILLIKESGIQVKSPDMVFPEVPKGDDYDWKELSRQLGKIKEQYPSSEDVIIAPQSGIRYQILIMAMDACREAGFPNISMSG
jgi:biopolymer transport protein ExbD